MKRLPKPLYLLFRTNFIKTVILNYKLLPKSIAKKLPIIVLGKVNISGCTGKITFTEPVYTGMVIIGELVEETTAYKRSCPMRFKIMGNLVLGKHIHIRGGGGFLVDQDGIMTIGNDTMINSYCRIWCSNKTNLGKNVRMSWECQLFDSNFHYMINEEGFVNNCKGSVFIGDNVWIGNRCTINKGTVLPNYTIVAACSFVNKDFSEKGERSIIGGSPAKLVKTGYRRLFNIKKEQEINSFFKK